MKLFKYILLLVSTLFLVAACTDFLETEIPSDQLDQHLVFNDPQTAEAAMNNIYVSLAEGGFFNGNSSEIGFLLGCYTDELDVLAMQNSDPRKFYDAAILADNTAVKRLWNTTYKQIYAVNNIIKGVEESENLSETVRNSLKGQAVAVRGILHFYLSQTFADVPYIKTTDYNVNKKVSRQSVSEVVRLAVDDLKEAEVLLEGQVDGVEKIRVNKLVVQAFLARMYLYQKNWSESLRYADMLVTNPIYVLEPLETLFLKQSGSAVWQLKPTITGFNTYEAMAHIFMANPAPLAQLSEDLLNTFEPDDRRKEHWVKFVGGTDHSAHSFKYKQRGFTSPTMEYSVVLRIEEMYLIAAEASAELSNWTDCNNYLNSIRSRAGLELVDLSDMAAAEKAVLKERRVELFCEFGHRFYDLKRRNKLMDLSQIKPNWMKYFETLPIPQDEIFLNGNLLPQNTGY